MATSNPSDINTKPIPAAQGEAVLYDGAIVAADQAAVAATADIVRFLRLPAGTRLCDAFVRTTTSFGATAPVTVRLAACDGASDAIEGASGATADLVAAGSTVLQTAGKVYLSFAPVTTKVDCFLECLFGTVVTGAKGVAQAVASGVALGAK